MGGAVSTASYNQSLNIYTCPDISREYLFTACEKYAENSMLSAAVIPSILTDVGASPAILRRIKENELETACTVDRFIDEYIEMASLAASRKQNCDEHARYRGITLEALIRFADQHNAWHLPTYDVVKSIVSAQTTCEVRGTEEPVRYCDIMDCDEVGPADVFVSHSWGNPFGLVVAACQDFNQWARNILMNRRKHLYYWLDTHAILQHQHARQGNDLNQLQDVIEHATYTLLVLDEAGMPLSRAWCVYEVATAVMHNTKIHVRGGTLEPNNTLRKCDRTQIWNLFTAVDLAQAQATYASDLEMIFDRAKKVEWEGRKGFEAVNWMIQRALLDMKFRNESAFSEEVDMSLESNRGRYTLTKRIHATIGEAYTGKRNHNVSQDPTRVKVVILHHLLVDENNLADAWRVINEIAMHIQLQHSHIANLLDIFFHEGEADSVVLVYEWMDTTLATILRSFQRFTSDHTMYFTYQILLALQYIHSKGVVHRDLKPDHITTNSNCDVKIGDFGNMRQMGSDEKIATDYVLLRWYRAIELLLECPNSDEKVDIWSLGCMIYEMVTRNVLFAGKDTLDQINVITNILGSLSVSDMEEMQVHPRAVQHLTRYCSDRVGILREKLSGVDEKIVDLISLMLTYNPRKRPSAMELMSHPALAHIHDDEYFTVEKGTYNGIPDNVEKTIEGVRQYLTHIIAQMDK